ncbi:MAG TPA: hypothetical protein VFF30_14355 [Nitrososphaerales archaeon]|nr:hypothetical protein [Nitrososphaerales archaeon]
MNSAAWSSISYVSSPFKPEVCFEIYPKVSVMYFAGHKIDHEYALSVLHSAVVKGRESVHALTFTKSVIPFGA